MLTIFAAIAVLGLARCLRTGHHPDGGERPGAVLNVSAPETVRGGLFFQSRDRDPRARARSSIRGSSSTRAGSRACRSTRSSPRRVSEASRDGRVVLSYDALAAGDRLRVWLQFEVDPTNVGQRSYGLELDDAETRLAAVHRDITVLP